MILSIIRSEWLKNFLLLPNQESVKLNLQNCKGKPQNGIGPPPRLDFIRYAITNF